jgi:hypothetical protein
VYSADAATIKRYFDEVRNTKAEQKTTNLLITGLNVEMESAGVHPGVMSMMHRIAAMPDGKRGLVAFLAKRYFEVLAEDLEDAAFDEEEVAVEEVPAPPIRPFKAA